MHSVSVLRQRDGKPEAFGTSGGKAALIAEPDSVQLCVAR